MDKSRKVRVPPTDDELREWMDQRFEEYYDHKTDLYDTGALALEAANYFSEWDEHGNPPDRYYEIAEEC